MVPQPHIVYLQKKTPLELACPLNITDLSIRILSYDWYREDEFEAPLVDVTSEDSFWLLNEKGSLVFKNGYRRRKIGKQRLAGVYECVVKTNKGDLLARKVQVKLAGKLFQNFLSNRNSCTLSRLALVCFSFSKEAGFDMTVLMFF